MFNSINLFSFGVLCRPSELCLAIYCEDGEWYRAMCLDVRANNFYNVMFVDYGNTSVVSGNDMLPITKELMFTSKANTCNIQSKWIFYLITAS